MNRMDLELKSNFTEILHLTHTGAQLQAREGENPLKCCFSPTSLHEPHIVIPDIVIPRDESASSSGNISSSS